MGCVYRIAQTFGLAIEQHDLWYKNLFTNLYIYIYISVLGSTEGDTYEIHASFIHWSWVAIYVIYSVCTYD